MELPEEYPIIFEIYFLRDHIEDIIQLPEQTEEGFRRFRWDLYNNINIDNVGLNVLNTVKNRYKQFLLEIPRPAPSFAGDINDKN